MDDILKGSLPKLREKLLESLQAVLPIVAIVLVLCFSIAPVSPSILLCFLLGAAMIIVGIMFFTLGAEMSMSPMGERVGAVLTKSRSVPLIIGVGFVLGFLITISEPDLQVLANQVPSIPNMTLILSVAAGVGFFLVVAFLRMLLSIALPKLLVVFYALIFVLAALVPKEFLAVAFDSGGVTTGPITVPFIMALGVGVAAIRSDRHAADDSFGLVALCSVGPILAVLLLGILFQASDSTYIPPVLPDVGDSVELWQLFHVSLPTYLKEIATSLLPIVLMFGVFQLVALQLDRRSLGRIGVGLLYTYIGLVLFLTGANVGFMPAGNYLGQVLAGRSFRWVLVPIGMLIGYFIVKAEPAVYVLNKQVEEITDGAISAGTMGAALSAGVSLSVGLAMVRLHLCHRHLLCGAQTLHRHRVRRGRRRFRPHDGHLPAAAGAGRVRGRGRQYRHRCLRRSGHGRHDAPHHGAAHGPDGAVQAAPRPQSAAGARRRAGLCRPAG